MSLSETPEKRWRSLLAAVLFITYLAGLMYIMFFAETLGRTGEEREYSYNLQLFREIRRFIHYRHVLGMKAVFWNLGGNVLCFMPFGFFVPWLWKHLDRWYLAGLLSLYLSLVIEVTQLLLRVGSFDVDDLLLNTVGGVLGYLCHWSWRRFCIRH